MPAKSDLLRKLDKRLIILRRPGDEDPVDSVEDIYGNRIDRPADGDADLEALCWGAYETVPVGSGRIEPDSSNRIGIEWIIDLEPDADVRHTDVIIERADPDDAASEVLHRFEPTLVDLVTAFDGTASHWEIRAREYR
jgi:hypothetical protein